MNSRRHAIKPQTWQVWMGQWSELLQSGMPVLDSLLLSGELQTGNRQGRLLLECLQRAGKFIQSGQTLQTAFRASFGALPTPLEVALMCGQASGDLGAALKEQTERWRANRESNIALGKSLIYPAVVLALALACWVFLHKVSNPHVAAIAPPRSGESAWANGLLLAGAVMVAVALWMKTARGVKRPERRFILPLGPRLASDFYHIIACELNAGLDLMHCLRHRNLPVGTYLGLRRFNPQHRMLEELNQLASTAQHHLRKGLGFGQAMQQAQAPQFLVRQSQLAEQTGNLAHCFFLAAKVYDMRARAAQERLQHILPPVALALSALTLALAYQFTLAPLYGNLTGLA
jgi:type II secretory pathway component PulF